MGWRSSVTTLKKRAAFDQSPAILKHAGIVS